MRKLVGTSLELISKEYCNDMFPLASHFLIPLCFPIKGLPFIGLSSRRRSQVSVDQGNLFHTIVIAQSLVSDAPAVNLDTAGIGTDPIFSWDYFDRARFQVKVGQR
jgi:hypothetical protein